MKNLSFRSLTPRVGGRIFLLWGAAVWAGIHFALVATASDKEPVYYSISLEELVLADGEALTDARYASSFQSPRRGVEESRPLPYVWLEGRGEAFVAPTEWPGIWSRIDRSEIFVAIAAETGETINGILFHPLAESGEGFARLPFQINPGTVAPVERDQFLTIKARHYERLAAGDFVGGAWFRRQLAETRAQLGIGFDAESREGTRRSRGGGLEQTFDLFSGGRAIAENLALDDRLDVESFDGQTLLPVSGIRGISIQEYDWAEMLVEQPAVVDTLAALIPSNQHGLFFRDAEGLRVFLKEWQENGLPLLSVLDPVSVPARLVERYEHQLGFSSDEASQLSSRGLIGSIAVTGGDPFFATGTDVAILMETSAPGELLQEFEARFREIAEREPEVRFALMEGALRTLSLGDPDRTRSATAVAFENAVILTNSPAQIDAIRRVVAGETQALAGLDEYLFFRARYPLADDDETGFLLLTDDTIRRWCGPEWRIGASRRLRAAALLSDKSAQVLPNIVAGHASADPDVRPMEAEWLGGVNWTENGPRSGTYNHLGFLTPISELKIETVSEDEARAYDRWRASYEAEWQEFFDPIAIRFSLEADRIGADVTVMPLTASSEYRAVIEVAGERTVAPGSGDPREDALAQFALAVDPDSEPMQMLAGMGRMMGADLGYNALGWMRGTVSLYFDDDLIWRAVAESEDLDQFLMRNFGRLPVALHVDSKDPVRLALFLSGLRTMIEDSAPGMVRWATRDRNGNPYVAITPTEAATAMDPEMSAFGLFYSARPDALVISLNEDVIRRSIDRFQQRQAGEEANHSEWLGDHLNLRLGAKGLRVLEAMFREDSAARVFAIAQAPVPLLNDWKTRFPEMDPLELLRTVWRVEAVCPAGGEYVWNDEYKTYESTRLGSVAMPRVAETLPAALRNLSAIRLGVTFENDGIRARGELIRGGDEEDSVVSDEAEQEEGAIETGSYYPLSEGASWVWEDIDLTTGETSRVTETVVRRETSEEGEFILTEGVWGPDAEAYRSWYSDSDGIRFHRTEAEDYLEVVEPSVLILPNRMIPGRLYHDQWTEVVVGDGEEYRIRNTVEYVLEGKESVEVEAGSFEDCLKVRSRVVTIERDVPALYTTQTQWFASGVGLVKSESESEWGRMRTELISSSLVD